jgi:signal recognition particle subunit SEC65
MSMKNFNDTIGSRSRDNERDVRSEIACTSFRMTEVIQTLKELSLIFKLWCIKQSALYNFS